MNASQDSSWGNLTMILMSIKVLQGEMALVLDTFCFKSLCDYLLKMSSRIGKLDAWIKGGLDVWI